MGPRRKITAAHSAANPRGPRTIALVRPSVRPPPSRPGDVPPPHHPPTTTPSPLLAGEGRGRSWGRGLRASLLPLIRKEMK